MKAICAVLAATFAMGCASPGGRSKTDEKPAASAAAAAQPAPATAASAPQAPPGTPPPMTAAEAAEKAHQNWLRSHGSGSDAMPARADGARPQASRLAGAAAADDAPCGGDDDCTLTRIGPESCCAMLCSPRAVTRTRGAELDRRSAGCQGCIEPLCRAPRPVQAACRAGRCVAQPVASPD
jgi:hypothetical protein